MINTEELMHRLEELGEDKVRKNLANNVYGREKRPIVEEWLKSKERERERQKITETLSIAKSAKTAKWIAAIAACVAALLAIARFLLN